MIVVVRRLIVELRNPINFDAPEARDSVPTATDMQVKRLWLPAWRAPCPEPWGSRRSRRGLRGMARYYYPNVYSVTAENLDPTTRHPGRAAVPALGDLGRDIQW